MAEKELDLERRVRELEGQARGGRACIAALSLVLAAILATGFSGDSENLKARTLTIIDEKGKARIILADKIPDPPGGTAPRMVQGAGMLITNREGEEQFGLSVNDDGSVGMGFDANQAPSSKENSERIHLDVLKDGRPAISIKDGKSRTQAMWYLDGAGKPWMGFFKWEGEGRDSRFTGLKKYGLSVEDEKIGK